MTTAQIYHILKTWLKIRRQVVSVRSTNNVQIHYF